MCENERQDKINRKVKKEQAQVGPRNPRHHRLWEEIFPETCSTQQITGGSAGSRGIIWAGTDR